jgi:hypothetical protein
MTTCQPSVNTARGLTWNHPNVRGRRRLRRRRAPADDVARRTPRRFHEATAGRGQPAPGSPSERFRSGACDSWRYRDLAFLKNRAGRFTAKRLLAGQRICERARGGYDCGGEQLRGARMSDHAGTVSPQLVGAMCTKRKARVRARAWEVLVATSRLNDAGMNEREDGLPRFLRQGPSEWLPCRPRSRIAGDDGTTVPPRPPRSRRADHSDEGAPAPRKSK